MKVLIKIGGTLLDEPAKRAQMATQLAFVAGQCQLVVVHGGGKQVTKFLEERGISSSFVGGLRVSDEAVIDAVTKVIAGGVNKQLVSAMIGADCQAVGISGVDGRLVEAHAFNSELKFTGQPTKTNSKLLDLLLGAGYTPVIACIAGDSAGSIFNVNADQLAVSCAIGWQADKLFFLTDVPGVKSAEGDVIAHLTASNIPPLIASGVASGGMEAKLRSSIWALESGLQEVVVAPGHRPDICQILIAGQNAGTSITLATAQVT